MNQDLLRYIAGDLDGAAHDAFEARLFEEPALAADAGAVLALRDSLRRMAALGPLVPVVTAAELRALSQRVPVTEHAPREGAICTRIRDEAFVAAHVPLTSTAPRVHVLFCTPDGAPYFRVNEAPFDASAGEVIILCERHVAVATGRLIIKVIDDSDALLGEVSITNEQVG